MKLYQTDGLTNQVIGSIAHQSSTLLQPFDPSLVGYIDPQLLVGFGLGLMAAKFLGK